jgi:mono/diheme cytochrome c family protein
VSYRWNDAGSEASLVPDGGADFDVGVTVSGSPYVQRWHVPSRAECLACHTPQAGHALSFTTRQLNRGGEMNGFGGNQLDLLRNAGYFANPPDSPNLLPRHIGPDETTYPVEARARSYLAVNCAYCHKNGGTAAPAVWDGSPELLLEATGLVNGAASNNGGNPANKLIVPGDTAHSVVLNRMAVTNGFTRMPPLATSELDQVNIALIADWITNSLPNRQTYADWRLAQFGSSNSPEGEGTFDADADGSTNTAEFLAGTQPRHGASFLIPQVGFSGPTASITFDVPANRSVLIETSVNLATWSLWDAPGNAGLPLPGGPLTISGPALGPKQFFRLRLLEN